MSDKLQDAQNTNNSSLDFEVVYAAINQAYDSYQSLCYELIIHQDNYHYCAQLLEDLLTIHRTIFSNEYRSFFNLMYCTAPAILFYIMQFHDVREIVLGSKNIVVNYRLLEKLVTTSQRYEEAAAFLKQKAKGSNQSLSNYKKLVKRIHDADDDSFELERLSMMGDGQIESLNDPDTDVFFSNINLNSRSLDGRTTLGREVKKYLNDEYGHFNYKELPRPKALRYQKQDRDEEQNNLDKSLDYYSMSALKDRLKQKDGLFLTHEAPIKHLAKKSKLALETKKNMSHQKQIELNSNDNAALWDTKGQEDESFFISPMVNNNTFDVMTLLSNTPAFGPINANRSRNYDLPGLSQFQKKSHQLLTVDLKDKIESLGSLIEKERSLIARQLRRLSINLPRLHNIFSNRLRLITINPNTLADFEQNIEDFNQDCFIIYLGCDLLVKPANNLSDTLDGIDENWLDHKINENFIIVTGFDLKLNLQNVCLPLSKRHKSFSLKQPYNIWKKQATLNKIYEGIYDIKINDIEKMPVVINSSTFGPYDLVYIKL